MLAGFYANAVLLRYQYPMMIITKTRDIFVKRQRRNKKMLTEEGSSDQSRSKTLSRSIQLHTNTFLDSINSSQLSKKTVELRDELFPEFNEQTDDKSFDEQVHDIHNPKILQDSQSKEKKETVESQLSFADKLMNLAQKISTKSDDQDTCLINLKPAQNQLNELIWDFDQVDPESTIKNYQKLKRKLKKNKSPPKDEEQTGFKKKYKVGFSPNQQHFRYLNNQKTLQTSKLSKIPREVQYSAPIQQELKNRYYLDSPYTSHQKSSAFYEARSPHPLDQNFQAFQQLEESYKTLERFRTTNTQKSNLNFIRPIYSNEDVFYRRKTNSQQQNLLPRHRSYNIVGLKKQSDDFAPNQNLLTRKQFSPHQQNEYQKYRFKTHQIQQSPRNSISSQSPSQYPRKHQTNKQSHRLMSDLQKNYQNRRSMNSPRFKNINQQQNQTYNNFSPRRYFNFQSQKIFSHLPDSSQQVFSSQRKTPIQEYAQNIDFNMQRFEHSPYYRTNFKEKEEKKKKIRQKAAQLLSRVKSHEYLTTKVQIPYLNRY